MISKIVLFYPQLPSPTPTSRWSPWVTEGILTADEFAFALRQSHWERFGSRELGVVQNYLTPIPFNGPFLGIGNSAGI